MKKIPYNTCNANKVDNTRNKKPKEWVQKYHFKTFEKEDSECNYSHHNTYHQKYFQKSCFIFYLPTSSLIYKLKEFMRSYMPIS